MNQVPNNNIVEVSAADMDRFRQLESYLSQQAAVTPAPLPNQMGSSPLIEKLKAASQGAPAEIPGVQKIKVGNNFDAPPSLANLNQFGQPQQATIQSEIFGGNGSGNLQPPTPNLFQNSNEQERLNNITQEFQKAVETNAWNPPTQTPMMGNVVNLSQPPRHDFSNLTPETQQVAQQMVSQNLVQRIQKNLKIFKVRLPSGGVYYPEGNTFRGIQEVEMRKILNRDDDIIRSSKLLNEGKAFTTLIRNLLMDKRLDPMDLFDGDLWALLIAARNQSFGDYYNPGLEYTCDFCESKFEHNFDMTHLEAILPQLEYRHIDNVFETKLPSCGLTALIRVFTNKDTEILTSIISAANRTMVHDKIDRTESTTARQHLVALDGISDPSELNDVFDNWIEVMDKLYIIEFAKEMEPRLKFVQDIMCPKCHGTMSERRIPFTDRLFTPKFFNRK